MTPTVLVLMGVSGSGKTTLGIELAHRLGWTFKEGDELHPAANLAKMRRGEPLTDADRAPWLAAVAAWIDAWIRDGASGVITCSALRRDYRLYLVKGRPGVAFVFLHGAESLLAERMATRQGHFMPPTMLASQLITLEPPAADEPVISVDIDQPVSAQVDAVVEALATCRGRTQDKQVA
jgi:carbohydrate kinase (thermoresistant glucokinase family)